MIVVKLVVRCFCFPKGEFKMKNKIKTIAAAATATLMLSSVCGAEMTLKSFDVSGGNIKASGVLDAEGKQVNLIISENGQTAGIYQSISGGGGEFEFDISSSKQWSGSFQAKFTSSDSDTATLDFSGDGSYVSPAPNKEELFKEPSLNVSGTAYGNAVHISGSLEAEAKTDKNVMLVIYKQTDGVKIQEDGIAYIDQAELNASGEFEFDFTLLDDIRYYKAAVFCGGKNVSEYVKIAKSAGEYVTADISLDVFDQGSVKVAELLASLENSGFEAADYMMIITAYDLNGMMIDVIKSDKKTIEAGGSASETLSLENLPSDTKTVKAMLWSIGETIIPLDSAATFTL